MNAVRAGTRRALRRLAVVAVLAVVANGCVYYNGIYNAKSAAETGDDRLRRGDEAGASAMFAQSAAGAETVLVRHPKSGWRSRALYLAGRGHAWSNSCALATPRLTAFLALADGSVRERESARLALAACESRANALVSARARLDSLVSSKDVETSRQARIWAARTALAAGDREAVAGYLAGLDVNSLHWELARVSLEAGEYARAESLVVLRAARGDFREDATRAVRDLWGAGQWDAAERVVVGYDLARVSDAGRAAMHYALGDLSLSAGRDSVARRHLATARALSGRDTMLAREAEARLAILGMTRASRMQDIDSVLARQDSTVRRTSFARRAEEQLLLVRLLERNTDATGASLFLAAEVARDSLRAPRLAQTLFLRVARDLVASPLAPNALYAASLLEPDSAAIWHAQIRNRFPNSAVTAWLRGDDPDASADFRTSPELLRFQWNEMTRIWSDSVRRLRAVPANPATNGRPPGL